MQDLVQSHAQPVVSVGPTPTVEEFLCDEWLPSMAMSVQPTTLEGYEGKIRLYILPRIGSVLLSDLSPPRINRMYADVRANGRVLGEAPLSLKTVREVHVVLRRALEDAVRWQYLDLNPVARANAPSASAARSARKDSIRTWTADEVAEFSSRHEKHELFPLWLLAAATGMRRSELLGLAWPSVSLSRRLVAVRHALVVVNGHPHLKDAPKSVHGFRTIWIPTRVAQELEALRAAQDLLRAGRSSAQTHPYVFCKPDGSPLHPDVVTGRLRELVTKSGLPPIRPLQDLRHTHATLLLADGENPKVVQERLGHHSHSFTADTYQHVMPGMDEAAADRFDDLVFGDPDE